MSADGARSGLSTREGCGSNVKTTAVPFAARAAPRTVATSAWCPRCTPSKLPTVTAGRGQPHGVSVSRRRICIRKTSGRLPRQRALDQAAGNHLAALVDVVQEIPALGQGVVVRRLPGNLEGGGIEHPVVVQLFQATMRSHVWPVIA